jgi:hypothetical protein
VPVRAGKAGVTFPTVGMSDMLRCLRIAIHHDLFAQLFPPGEPEEAAGAACYRFAQSMACRIENKPETKQIWFVKDA